MKKRDRILPWVNSSIPWVNSSSFEMTPSDTVESTFSSVRMHDWEQNYEGVDTKLPFQAILTR
jgi:hypothetical protein